MDSLVYVSQATRHFNQSSVNKLAYHASQSNESLAITGFLCYCNGRFLQYLEGEAQALDNLMNMIGADPRHTVIAKVYLPSNPQRRFSIWHMRYLLPHEEKSIGLEDLLAEVLMKMDTGMYSKEEITETVRIILDKTSSYYAACPPSPSLPSGELT